MSDTERQARVDPSPQTRLALVRERLRRGDLSTLRVRIAAGLGHPIASSLFSPAAADLREALALLDPTDERLFACDCAERVLPLFENRMPADLRPREALRVARRFARGRASAEDMANAARGAWEASREAFHNAGRLAWVKGNPAMASARTCSEAARAPAAIVAASATRAVGEAAPGYTATNACRREQDWQRQLLGSYLLGLRVP